MKPEIVLETWIKAPVVGSLHPTYFPQSAVFLVDSFDDDSCSVTLHIATIGDSGITPCVRFLACPAEELIAVVEEIRKSATSMFYPPPRVLTPEEQEEFDRKEMEKIEKMGEAIQRGAAKAQSKKDRDSWGRPGEE